MGMGSGGEFYEERITSWELIDLRRDGHGFAFSPPDGHGLTFSSPLPNRLRFPFRAF